MPSRPAAAVEEVVARQLEVGIDIVNNGEMARESFFTYVQHRMSGFSGHCQRRPMRDLTDYPDYLARLTSAITDREGNVSLLAPPCATGDVRYLDSRAIEAECHQLAEVLAGLDRAPADAFVSAPSPGIIAATMENQHYESLDDYVAALAAALAVEYRTIVEAGFTLQIDAPDLAMERHTLFQDKPLSDFQDFLRLVVGAINAALEGIDRDSDPAPRLLGQLRGSPRLRRGARRDLARDRRKPRSVPSCCPWPTPGTPTSTACSRTTSCRRVRASSPA